MMKRIGRRIAMAMLPTTTARKIIKLVASQEALEATALAATSSPWSHNADYKTRLKIFSKNYLPTGNGEVNSSS